MRKQNLDAELNAEAVILMDRWKNDRNNQKVFEHFSNGITS